MIEGAIDAFLAARFEQARSLLADCESPAAKLLLVRTLMRLNAIDDADAVASSLMAADLEAHDRGEILVLRYGLAIRGAIGRDIEACRAAAAAFVRRNDDTEVECEFWFFEAYHAFASRDLERCERAAWDAIHCDLTIAAASPRAPSRIAPTSNSKARALQFVGLVRGAQGRFHEQARFLREAVVTLRRSSRVDLFAMASLYMNLAFQLRDLGALDDIVTLEIIETDDWPDSLAMMKLEVGVARGWLYALRGDDDLALTTLEALQHMAAPAANLITAATDLAALSRLLRGNVSHAALERALERFERDVRGGDPSQWFSLPMLARELSYLDPRRAEALLAAFDALPAEFRTLVSVDDRSKADVEYAKGIVAANLRRPDAAIDHLNSAYAIWVECGFRWQATMAALDVAKAATVRGASFLRYARREAQNYPDSWLAKDVATASVTAER